MEAPPCGRSGFDAVEHQNHEGTCFGMQIFPGQIVRQNEFAELSMTQHVIGLR